MAKSLYLSLCIGVVFLTTLGYIFVSTGESTCGDGECESSNVELYPPESIYAFTPDKMGFDEIYVINLKRRPERKERMEQIFKTLRLNVTFWEASDGQDMTNEWLEKSGFKVLPGYLDPYHQRPMTFGEIGCFLSHYYVWQDIIDKGYTRALILEDDASFQPSFRHQWSRMYAEIEELVPNWDLIYLGRKEMRKDSESAVDNSQYLVWPHYSYWTVSYAISRKGAKKLIDQRPLKKLVAVDEYLPIMFDRNPSGEEFWNKNFFPRNLVAVAINPLLVNPSWVTGHEEYNTDTESSATVEMETEDETGGE